MNANGILGEFLRLLVICTINCALKELDQALLRPGRLMAHHCFGPLDAERAKALAKKLGKPLPETAAPSYTLAGIFSDQPDPTRRERERIGFGGQLRRAQDLLPDQARIPVKGRPEDASGSPWRCAAPSQSGECRFECEIK